jgi:hypothetical protein
MCTGRRTQFSVCGHYVLALTQTCTDESCILWRLHSSHEIDKAEGYCPACTCKLRICEETEIVRFAGTMEDIAEKIGKVKLDIEDYENENRGKGVGNDKGANNLDEETTITPAFAKLKDDVKELNSHWSRLSANMDKYLVRGIEGTVAEEETARALEETFSKK